MDTPFREGYEAGMDGKADGGFANPYPDGSIEHLDWALGWNAACEDEFGGEPIP